MRFHLSLRENLQNFRGNLNERISPLQILFLQYYGLLRHSFYSFLAMTFPHCVIASILQKCVAIHNPKSRFKDSIVVIDLINLAQHYRLPRLLTKSRKDARAESDYQSLRKFCKLVRNDKWRIDFMTISRKIKDSKRA
ncbi:hypothetical protein [Helicobacter sp.]|uniref:hypothetical protein n=1 Tax=Helicobacter sp. TaxID=218 RepID=UPI0019BF0745|nr:hypothetical protein [Helicobacter sp.]MBD5164974.1 hypothetical protein [Helicobacter sp.]